MRRIGPSAALLAVVALAHQGCSRSSGQDRDFVALSANVGGADLVPLNAELRVAFSQEIARDPVPAVYVFESESNGTRSALGALRVQGKAAVFTPALPTLPDLSDAGLQPGTHYTICVPRAREACAPELPAPAQPLRSASGRPLARSFTATFRTLGGPFPFRDPALGPPGVTATDPPAGATEVPPGTPAQPTAVTLTWTEPLLPSTATSASVGLFRMPLAVPVSLASIRVQQNGTAGARLVLTPRAPLACDAAYEVRWTGGVTDLAGNAALVPATFPSFRTTANCPPVSAIIERFESHDFRDPPPSFTAPTTRELSEWFVDGRPVLRAGYGFGGGGVDGALRVPAGTVLDLRSIRPGGTFQFTSLAIEAGATVTHTGFDPVRLLCTGDADVQGVIDLSGAAGLAGPAGDTSRPVPGGPPRAGGGGGGVANAVPGALTVPLTARGQGPFASTGGGFGGNDSHVAIANPVPQRVGCGGGGGAYGDIGINGWTGCANAGGNGSLRGTFYGDALISVLLGGSGGGAGGNAALISTPATPFPNLVSHAGGGGGAGGGALGIECVGTLTLGPVARLVLNGGNAGPGGGPAGGKGGDGGAGSGGACKLQAGTVSLDGTARITALGGMGASGPPTYGTGGPGRVRLEDLDGSVANPSVSTPVPSVGPLTVPHAGRTVAQSLFYDTGLPNPSFTFDGSDPGTGRALGNTDDLEFAELPLAGQSVFLSFQGAPPDPANPDRPDPDSTRWVPPQPAPGSGVPFANDVETLSRRNLRFLRFRVELEIGPFAAGLPRRTAIDTIRIRFQESQP
jgi:hypothetical protein